MIHRLSPEIWQDFLKKKNNTHEEYEPVVHKPVSMSRVFAVYLKNSKPFITVPLSQQEGPHTSLIPMLLYFFSFSFSLSIWMTSPPRRGCMYLHMAVWTLAEVAPQIVIVESIRCKDLASSEHESSTSDTSVLWTSLKFWTLQNFPYDSRTSIKRFRVPHNYLTSLFRKSTHLFLP